MLTAAGAAPGVSLIDAGEVRAKLAAARAAAFERLGARSATTLSISDDGMEALRGGVAHVRASSDRSRREAIDAIATVPVIVAAWHRRLAQSAHADRADSRGFDHVADTTRDARRAGALACSRSTALETYLPSR